MTPTIEAHDWILTAETELEAIDLSAVQSQEWEFIRGQVGAAMLAMKLAHEAVDKVTQEKAPTGESRG